MTSFNETTAAPVPSSREADAAQYLFQLCTGFMVSSALQAATRLDIADLLKNGPRPVSDLAESTRTDPDALYRLLRALSSAGVFEELPDGRFRLNAPAELLRSDVPSARAMVLWMTDSLHFNVYADMLYSIQSGKPAIEKRHGVSAFEYFAKNPAVSEVFNDAMTMFSAMIVPAVLETYDFSDAGLVVDVAGGHGGVLTAILQRYPRLQGVLFDQEHVIAGAKGRIASLGLAERCRLEAGDFFKAVPAGDTYVLKHIIHDWDDDRAIQILRNIRSAMRDANRGKVVLIEAALGGRNTPDINKLIDLEMLMLPGGRERTAAEYAALLDRAGFRMTRVVPNASPLSTIEAKIK